MRNENDDGPTVRGPGRLAPTSEPVEVDESFSFRPSAARATTWRRRVRAALVPVWSWCAYLDIRSRPRSLDRMCWCVVLEALSFVAPWGRTGFSLAPFVGAVG